MLDTNQIIILITFHINGIYLSLIDCITKHILICLLSMSIHVIIICAYLSTHIIVVGIAEMATSESKNCLNPR
jgi:dolichol kinase